MTIIEKIEKLNTFCNGSLGFTHYSAGWEISSFKDKTFFGIKGKLYKKNHGYLLNKSFESLVNETYELISKE